MTCKHLSSNDYINIILNILLQVESELITNSSTTYKNLQDLYGVKTLYHNFQNSSKEYNWNIIFAPHLITSCNNTVLQNIINSADDGGFIITEEGLNIGVDIFEDTDLMCCGKQVVGSSSFLLLKRKDVLRVPLIVQITEKNLDWLNELKEALKVSNNSGQPVLLYNQGEDCLGNFFPAIVYSKFGNMFPMVEFSFNSTLRLLICPQVLSVLRIVFV